MLIQELFLREFWKQDPMPLPWSPKALNLATGSELARSGGRGGGRGGGRMGGRGGRGGGRLATQGKGNGKGGSASATALNSPTRRPFGAMMATEGQSGVLEEYPSKRGK